MQTAEGTTLQGLQFGHRLLPRLTWVRVGLFHRSAISLKFSGRSSSCSACAASSRFRQKGSSHTGLALQLESGIGWARCLHSFASKTRPFPWPDMVPSAGLHKNSAMAPVATSYRKILLEPGLHASLGRLCRGSLTHSLCPLVISSPGSTFLRVQRSD